MNHWTCFYQLLSPHVSFELVKVEMCDSSSFQDVLMRRYGSPNHYVSSMSLDNVWVCLFDILPIDKISLTMCFRKQLTQVLSTNWNCYLINALFQVANPDDISHIYNKFGHGQRDLEKIKQTCLFDDVVELLSIYSLAQYSATLEDRPSKSFLIKAVKRKLSKNETMVNNCSDVIRMINFAYNIDLVTGEPDMINMIIGKFGLTSNSAPVILRAIGHLSLYQILEVLDEDTCLFVEVLSHFLNISIFRFSRVNLLNEICWKFENDF